MANGVQSGLTADALEVQELVRRVRSGQIRVPNFQRGLRWGYAEVRALFDSILRDFPIGNLLLWQRPAEEATLTLGAIHLEAPAMSNAWWVVDGQQRITSLYNALSEEAVYDARFALSYDLEAGRIVRRTDEAGPLVIPLPVLFDLTRVLAWARDNPEVADRIEEVNSITARIRQFRIPIYLVEQDDEGILREIFDRMNNSGKKLTRAEVFSALNPGTRDDQSAIELIADRISQEFGFGRIDDDTVLAALLARRGADVQREIRLEFDTADRKGAIDFTNEDRDTAFAEGEKALSSAVLFLQEKANVPHFSFLPYRYLLVVLTRFFGLHPEVSERDLVLLRRWFWRAALIGPALFKGSTTGTTRQFNRRIRKDGPSESVQRLLEAISGRKSEPLRPQNFRTNESTARVILCAWWKKRPRSPRTGREYEIVNLTEVIGDRSTPADAVPRLRSGSRAGRYSSWASNRILTPDQEIVINEVESDFMAAKRGMDLSSWNNLLSSHTLTPDLLNQWGEPEFFVKREELIESDLKKFIELMCEYEMEDTPPLDQLIFDVSDESEMDLNSDLLGSGGFDAGP
ncbi:DUF262 domain-containing protein [Amycolatopsis sacchari]|uniref:GmrSD restriction endonucleases N-terminal domain-containing protein n=1 Tax=Amycolatopsis sacchari TaxID=115433 RepID=A0A1I4DNG4_9PSEU|nr:DUF262 domain-containing protein [Amycolatopsis sacchari]SFK93877.1 Protein of unknown function DUF262 [Amycolatopsis sacchari]